MTSPSATEGLLRGLAPQALGAVVRRFGNFADAEDAVQEALIVAIEKWPVEGVPDNPMGWLIKVASRRMMEQFRRDDARRQREDLVMAGARTPPDLIPGTDDTLILMFHVLSPDALAIRGDPFDAPGDRWTHDEGDCRCLSRPRGDDGSTDQQGQDEDPRCRRAVRTAARIRPVRPDPIRAPHPLSPVQ